ncbi:class I SAM-dependent DNA methyltransferase [Paenibacillus hexagrammi]|uniref:Class I SAM-dependent methyltransferase n=1 Tax=Paenibacillus hexagrammi TaxID=2908839 RepID=A0ABY3SNL5_9BACL|nr:class I SAM-dependent methyltransferase [Paenibacillus sp. YPD9-1]UJF35025.1 class I SAM-dependent methyltransferase [Paenibacillus sp. YPD9-1]
MSYEGFAYTYDRLMEEMPYGEWLRFARNSWDKFGLKPETVVDLGCGTGSIAIPLANEGFQVTGIDLSDDMLSVAQQKAEQLTGVSRKGGLIWVQQDLREWELPEPADAALSFCDCFNYLLEEEDIIQAFKMTYQGLKAGGLFLFDVHTPEQLKAYADSQPFFLNEDDVSYIWTSELDEERMQIEHDLTIFVQERDASDRFRRIDEIHVQRAYSLHWLKEQLLEVGFSKVEMGSDFTWQTPGSRTERAFFAAMK